MSKLLKQIDRALESSDTSDAVRLWLWLQITNGGECSIFDLLSNGLPNVVPAMNLLHASRRVKFVGDRVSALPYTKPTKQHRTKPTEDPLKGLVGRDLYKAALENPRVRGAAQAMVDAEQWVFDAYNRGRQNQKLHALPARQRDRYAEHWRSAAEFILAKGIDVDKFIAFAYERTRWQKTKFPAASLIGGDWLRQEWADKDAGKARDHAGHSYESGEGLQGALASAGFERAKGLDEKMIRHVFKMAKTLKNTPHLREPHSDEDVEAMVQWAAKNFEGL